MSSTKIIFLTLKREREKCQRWTLISWLPQFVHSKLIKCPVLFPDPNGKPDLIKLGLNVFFYVCASINLCIIFIFRGQFRANSLIVLLLSPLWPLPIPTIPCTHLIYSLNLGLSSITCCLICLRRHQSIELMTLRKYNLFCDRIHRIHNELFIKMIHLLPL